MGIILEICKKKNKTMKKRDKLSVIKYQSSVIMLALREIDDAVDGSILIEELERDVEEKLAELVGAIKK